MTRTLLDEIPWVLLNIYLALTTLFGALRLILLYAYCRRFSDFPIKERSPVIGVVVQLGILFFTEIWMYEIYAWDHFPCWLDTFASHFLLFLTCAVFAVRALGLYWNYNKCVEALEAERESLQQLTTKPGQQRRSNSSTRRKWFLERRWIGSPAYLRLFILILALCHFVEFVVTSLSYQITLSTTMPDCDLNDGWIKFGIALGYGCFCLLLAIDMRSLADNFFIKNELAIVGWVTMCGVAGWFLFDLFLTNINRQSALSLVVLYIASLVIFYASIMYPLNKSLKKGLFGTSLGELLMPKPSLITHSRYTVAARSKSTSGATDELPIDTASFLAVLNDPPSCSEFSKFLIRELNVENLLFWQNVNRYRCFCLSLLPEAKADNLTLTPSPSESIARPSLPETDSFATPSKSSEKLTPLAAYTQALDQATQTMIRFVRADGELQVNLPAVIVQNLEEKFRSYRYPTPSAPSSPPTPSLVKSRTLPRLFAVKRLSLMGGSELSPRAKSKTTWDLETNATEMVVEKKVVTTTTTTTTTEDKSDKDKSDKYWEDVKALATLFDEAQTEIFRLMRYDPYQRFARTEQGTKCRTKLACFSPEPSKSAKDDSRQVTVPFTPMESSPEVDTPRTQLRDMDDDDDAKNM